MICATTVTQRYPVNYSMGLKQQQFFEVNAAVPVGN